MSNLTAEDYDVTLNPGPRVLVSCLIPQFFAFQGKDLFDNNKEKDKGLLHGRSFVWIEDILL